MKTIKVGKKTIVIRNDNFEYFQPNTRNCGDCAVRAVAKALNKTWYDTFDALTPIAREKQTMPNDTEVVGELLLKNGFKWVSVSPSKGKARPTVSSFAKSHKEKCVLRVAHHLVASENHKFYDIWDSGDRSLYGYWIKNEK